jgi:SLT domain-containing protein
VAGSQTLRFDIVGDASSASRAFKQTAGDAALAARGAKQLGDSLTIQSKSAQVSAAATVSLAKSDDILRDAQLALAGATEDASGSLAGLKLRLDAVNGKAAAARVSLDGDKEAQAQLDAIDARLVDLDHKTSTPNLDIQGVAKATAELSAVDVALGKVGGSGGSAQGAASSLGLLASPMGAAVAAGVALAPVLVTTSVGLAGFGAAAAATVAPVLAAGTATKAQQQALAGLDPAQKAAYTSLGALKTEFGGFAKALEPETLGLFSKGLQLADGLLTDVEPGAAATRQAQGVLVGDISADLKTQQWQQFFGFMAQSAGPDIQLVGSLFTDLLNDLPQLLEELQPVAQGLLTVADDATLALKAVDTLNPSLSATSVNAAKVQTNSGNMFTRFLASSKLAISQVTGIGVATGAAATGTMSLATASTSLGDSLVTLEDKYGLTADQAEALITAAKQTNQALAGGDASARAAMTAIEAYANANLAAKTPTQQLAADVSTLGNNTLGATAQLNAFTDAWNLLVGNSVSDQQAVLATSQAFQALVTEVHNSGAQSLTSQSDFLSYVSSVGQGLSTLEKNGASVATVNAYYQTNIDRLNSLHNLTPAQRADVQGLTRDYDTWAHSTAGLNSQTAAAASTIKNNFTANLKALGEFTPGINTDVNNLAAAVLRTGTQSSATQGDRAKLIADLNKVGIYGQAATTLVDGLERKIAGLKGKTVAVDVTIGGEGAIVASAVGLPARIFKLSHMAAGGRVPGFGGGDRVPALLEGGEVVVPKGMVAGGAVDHLRGKLPGFAAGGLVDAAPWSGGQGSGAAGGWAGSWVQGEVAAFFTAARAAAAAAAAAGTPVAYSKVAGVTQWEPDVSKVLSWLGLPQGDLPTVMSQIQTESGGNPNAINLTDINAQRGDPSKGLMQVISETFAAYRSPSLSSNIYDPLANIFAGVNYAVHRYGNPGWLSVLGHGHGYANGTSSARPGLALVGERGPELVNFRGGEQVIPHQFVPGRGSGQLHVHLHNEGVIGSQAELSRWLNNGIDELARSSKLTYALQRSPSAAR